jgi:hypothetical protein
MHGFYLEIQSGLNFTRLMMLEECQEKDHTSTNLTTLPCNNSISHRAE